MKVWNAVIKKRKEFIPRKKNDFVNENGEKWMSMLSNAYVSSTSKMFSIFPILFLW